MPFIGFTRRHPSTTVRASEPPEAWRGQRARWTD